MKLQQLSLFLENKPGQVKVPCRILAQAGINILSLSLADTQQFGILRLLVKDSQKAKAALQAGGCVVNVTEVLAIDVADHPGGLADLLEIIDASNLSIEYMYAFTWRPHGRALLIFRFENPDAAVVALSAAGIDVIDSSRLFE
jgi:hypothetical protein